MFSSTYSTSPPPHPPLRPSLPHFSPSPTSPPHPHHPQTNIAACQQLQHRGQEFIEADHYAVDCIRPKCLELLRVVHDYNEMARLRNRMLNAMQTLHKHIDLVSRVYFTLYIHNLYFEIRNYLIRVLFICIKECILIYN